jgi:hypothetical protein
MTTMTETVLNTASLNTTPLFQTSLRSWQAAWRAEKGQAADPPAPATPTLHRLGRFKRRTRRTPEAHPQE